MSPRKLLIVLVATLALAIPSTANAGYAGKTIMPRDIAALGAEDWGGVGLVKAVATALAESHGSIGAWHDNVDLAGFLNSRDCGLYQINIPARYVGTELEFQLRTPSLDPLIYLEAAAYNVMRAKQLYSSPWRRDNHPDIRQWQPWVAYTQGWATFPEWWVWARPTLDHWAATGRYIQQAIPGVANYRLVIKKDVNQAGALYLARKYAAAFKVKGVLGIQEGIVKWISHPPKPTQPPVDNVGPRPRLNDGV